MTGRGIRAALRAYPAAYRRERGSEIEAVYAELAAGAGRLARAREVLSIAGYGLRVRTGLTFAGTAGRLLAQTAPVALGAGIGAQLGEVWILAGVAWRPGGGMVHERLECALALAAVWGLALVAAGLGRWTAARWIAAAGVIGGLAQALLWGYPLFSRLGALTAWTAIEGARFAGTPLLWLVMLLAAPSDLLGRPRWRGPAAGAVGAVLLIAGDVYIHTPLFWDQRWWPLQLLLLTLPLLGLVRGRLLPAAVALGLLPLLLAWRAVDWIILAGGPRRLVELAAGLVVLTALGCWWLRRPVEDEPPAVG